MTEHDTTADDGGEQTETDRIEQLEAAVETLAERIVELETEHATGGSRSRMSRRSLLGGALGLVGLAGLSATTASANPQGQVGTSSDPLRELNVEAINTGLASSEFELSVDGNRALGLSVQNAGGNSIAGHVLLGHADNQATGAGATVSGGGKAGAANSAGELSAVGGGQNNQADTRWATISGGVSNEATARQTAIGGGNGNTVSEPLATVGGGWTNTASGSAATVGGGHLNEATARYATIAGGGPSDYNNNPRSTNNVVYDNYCTIGGGGNNQAGSDDSDATTAEYATVSGGKNNSASGEYAIVPGGQGNSATAPNSFAGGTNATAEHEGAFVWCDTSQGGIKSITPNEFVVSASGGTVIFSNEGATTGVELSSGSGSWSSASSRSLKSDIEPVSGEDILERVTDLEISRWSYDSQPGVRHMGPMAEEFYDAFELGDDEEQISTVDADGVAFAAIQGLAEREAETSERVDDAEERLDETDDRVAELEAENEALRSKLEELRAEIEFVQNAMVAADGGSATDTSESGGEGQ